MSCVDVGNKVMVNNEFSNHHKRVGVVTKRYQTTFEPAWWVKFNSEEIGFFEKHLAALPLWETAG